MISLKLLFLLFIVFTFAKIPPPRFDFKSFDNATSFLLNGNASLNLGNLSLNTDEAFSFGSVWFYEKVYINNFKTFFTVSIEGENETTGGDGIAFVIQNTNPNAIADNQVGGIGYGSGVTNDPNTGIVKSLSIEFDTYLDTSLNDPSDNHVSIHTNNTSSNSANEIYRINNRTLGSSLRNNVFNVSISWDESNQILVIEYNNIFLPILTAEANLYEILNTTEEVWIGFTASSNQFPDTHKVLNWSFNYNGEISPENSFVYDFTNLTAGEDLSFYIQAVDQYGHNISAQNESFTVNVGSSVINTRYLGEGLFSGDLNNITLAQNYQIKVTYLNQSLSGGPYNFTVFPAQVYVPNSVVSGRMGGVAGTWLSFQLTLKDVYGNVATNARPNLSINFTVTGPSNSHAQYNHTVVQQGVVNLGYTTTVAGTYNLYISVEGIPIPGSPFSAEISDGAIDASFCSASGQGVSAYGNVSSDNVFAITIRDQYQNIITVQPTNMSIYIQITGPKGNFPIYDYNWDDNAKQYMVHYKTNISGFYLINISINGNPIEGSPYSSRILPETEAFSNNTRIKGIANNEIAGIQNFFTVVAYDQFDNQLETNTTNVFVQVISSFENIQTTITYAGHGSYNVYWSSKYENWGVFITVFVNNMRVVQFVTNINASVIDPLKCILDGNGYASADKGQKSMITLRARDSFDNTVKGHHSFSVSIKNFDNPKVIIEAAIQSVGDGTFNIYYVPKSTGNYVITVQYKGQDIRGSPSFLVVNYSVSWGPIIGLIIGSITVVTIIVAISYFYWLRYKSKFQYQVVDDEIPQD